MGEGMSRGVESEFSFRLMTADDIGRVPIGCQGGEAALRARIADVGSAAVLAFDGAQHVAQLQFRRYDSACRSPNGLWDPLYWGEFGDAAPALPADSLSIFCYHVGQLDDSEHRDARYQGRGLGVALLDYLLDWAVGAGFAAVTAKATPPHRAVMAASASERVGAGPPPPLKPLSAPSCGKWSKANGVAWPIWLGMEQRCVWPTAVGRGGGMSASRRRRTRSRAWPRWGNLAKGAVSCWK